MFEPGSGWARVGTAGADGEVASILVTGDESFCIAGSFSTVSGVPAANVACWNGSLWSQLGFGLPGAVTELAQSPDGTFYAGGTLSFIVDPSTGDYNAGIAVLNGQSWEPFQGGIDNGFINEVRAVAFAPDGDLLIGGTFSTADKDNPVPASNLARFDFDGGGWSEVAGGVVNEVGAFLPSVLGVNDVMVLDDGALLVSGLFSSVGGGEVQASNIARLEGDAWSPLIDAAKRYDGLAGLANELVTDGEGRLIAGGYFSTAGGERVSNVARLEADGWEALRRRSSRATTGARGSRSAIRSTGRCSPSRRTRRARSTWAATSCTRATRWSTTWPAGTGCSGRRSATGSTVG
jgi:hypothetical protein